MKALINLNNEQKMSSREIASLTGKNHQHVLRDCDKLNEHYEEMGLSKIGQGYYTHPNTGSQKHREYLLTKMQCFDLLTGYRTDLRIKVNRRWAELEEQAQQVTLPTTYKEALLELIKKEEEKEVLLLQNQEQQAQLEAQAPKVLFTEAVMGSKTSCLIGELAKVITQNGYEIGERRLFKYLRENGYLGRKGERYNIPNQKYVEQGIFELKKGTRSGSGGVMHTTITTKVTGKGQVYFVNKFLKRLQSA
ncbi:phage regulatory protein/antirepressor Ant [Riemerella anatipestifer]|uniref:phage regulatory protein/antirepressor Ant n=1 Tax=Riemerella anatipestifer TaxID=34085 RepID=UPI0021D5C632|nr:phage regulatory protein/antirepressor Ant [Riemerella anatipestifer]WCS66370.1 antirepressor [Riemerella phage vB_RanS_CRP5]WIL01322.1 antirepressor [Riemerella phage vB_RanS_CRP6]WIT94465.1 antirepressor [Riemerella phage vB_RanS_CRP19]MCU7583623.1 phage regulatory protein/antirepressor Ant [Riemerella anatipestifer]MCW0487076.1 phage regulatory protein/antirepressor Ant [Riemerella anatipestifer]